MPKPEITDKIYDKIMETATMYADVVTSELLDIPIVKSTLENLLQIESTKCARVALPSNNINVYGARLKYINTADNNEENSDEKVEDFVEVMFYAKDDKLISAKFFIVNNDIGLSSVTVDLEDIDNPYLM